MDKKTKLEALRQLTEADLRRQVLIPLLSCMEYRAAAEYHGPREHGKDIICFSVDKLGQRRFLAVVAKTNDLSGSVTSSHGLMEVIRQTEQCFNEDYHDLFGMTTITMDEVWVVTSGRVVPGAADSIIGTLKKTNLAKLTRIIAGEQLVELIDQYWPMHWDNRTETFSNLQFQRNRLIALCRTILERLQVPAQVVDEIVNQALYSSFWTPRVDVFDSDRWRVRHASTYSIEVQESSSNYINGFTSRACGDLIRAMRDAQSAINYELYEVEDLLEKAAKATALTDPWEFVGAFESDLQSEFEYRSRHGYHRRDPLHMVNYLVDGLRDVDSFLEMLALAGRESEYRDLVRSVEALEPEVTEYLTHATMSEVTLFWELSHEGDRHVVKLLYDRPPNDGGHGFVTRHQRQSATTSYSRESPLNARDVIDSAQNAMREHIEAQLSRDTKSGDNS